MLLRRRAGGAVVSCGWSGRSRLCYRLRLRGSRLCGDLGLLSCSGLEVARYQLRLLLLLVALVQSGCRSELLGVGLHAAPARRLEERGRLLLVVVMLLLVVVVLLLMVLVVLRLLIVVMLLLLLVEV